MAISVRDRRLLTRVRQATGAQNESRIPPEVLEKELVRAKDHLTDELRQALETGTFNFYAEHDPEELLFNFLCIRVRGLEKARDNAGERIPDTVSGVRRFDFKDSQMNFWRDEIVRRMNRMVRQNGD